MARSEAQKAADARYAKKINGKYKPFIVNLDPAELARINAVIGYEKSRVFALGGRRIGKQKQIIKKKR